MSNLQIVIAVGGLLIAAIVFFLGKSGSSSKVGATKRLKIHLGERSDYLVFVALPTDKPSRWEQVTIGEDQQVIAESGDAITLADVEGFVVAYPNGQVVDAEFVGLPPPRAVSFLPQEGEADERPFDYEQITRGQEKVGVEYEPSPAHAGDESHYRTTLTNLTDQPIRITGFSAAFVKQKRGALVRLIPGRLYGVDEFVNWYGADEDGWLQPGAKVSDPNNWGKPPVVWVYHCETQDGGKFVTGGLRE